MDVGAIPIVIFVPGVKLAPARRQSIKFMWSGHNWGDQPAMDFL